MNEEIYKNIVCEFRKCYIKTMKDVGYVLVARDGAIYKDNIDGTSEFIKEIAKSTHVDKSIIINLRNNNNDQHE